MSNNQNTVPIFDILLTFIGPVWSKVKRKAMTDDRWINPLKFFSLIPGTPDSDFDSIYAYTLAEYGRGKHRAKKRLFRHVCIKNAFRQAFELRDPSILVNEAENLLEWSDIGKEFRKLDYDPKQEIPTFSDIFIQMVQKTRDPSEIMRDQNTSDIEEKIDNLSLLLQELDRKLKGELGLSFDWFQYRFRKQLAGVGDKFIPELHSQTNVDYHAHAILGDDVFVEYVQNLHFILEENLENFLSAVKDLQNPYPFQINWERYNSVAIEVAENLGFFLNDGFSKAKVTINELSQYQYEAVRQTEWDEVLEQLVKSYDEYAKLMSDIDISDLKYSGEERERIYASETLSKKLLKPQWIASDFIINLRYLLEQLNHLSKVYLHILGEAGTGKTHIASHICQSRLNRGLPAILILGRHFTSDHPLHEQLLVLLDIPKKYTFQNFLTNLSSYAKKHKTRIPIFIDGLNEAIHQGLFSNVWSNDLPGFIEELSQYEDIVLVSTCRTSYREVIWPENDDPNIIPLYGFDSHNIESAIEKYFEYYKIQGDLTEASISQFEHPIYLRIFCESANPEREEEIQVYVGEETLNEIFDNFLVQANRRIVKRLGLHQSVELLIPSLEKVAEYLWEHKCRGVPINDFAMIIDGKAVKEIIWLASRSHAIESEVLLIYRDRFEGVETVYLTHDLLAGYIIAQYLLQRADNYLQDFINSEEITSLLFSGDYLQLHPLHEDIRRSLAVLLPIKTKNYLYELIDDETAFSISINALFEIPPHAINDNAVKLVIDLFDNPEYRDFLFQRLSSTLGHINHPFNSQFLSDRLESLSMSERDLYWTEYVRENSERIENTIMKIENSCRYNNEFSELTQNRLYLQAEYVMLILTSSIRSLRDRATRALYWYGRRFPKEFLDLVVKSFNINDPYVSERMLAASYGIAMARQYDFEDQSYMKEYLPKYGRILYDLMFSPDAQYSTTHILVRDYVRRTIDIALIHHPDLLSPDEKLRIAPPFRYGGIRDWGESEDGKDGQYKEPIRMDFANYTLGRLIASRSNYDFENEEYREVLSNIYWRIYALGYRTELFERVDELICRQNEWRGRHENRGKIDRYGKKYSWIAFYEIAGYRQDQGLLNGIDRISDVDIDPSFPENAPDFNLVHDNFLGEPDSSTQAWILNGGIPDLSPHLAMENLLDQSGPWVLLDGFINQENPTMGRKSFIFTRGFIVDADLSDELLSHWERKNTSWRSQLQAFGDYYTYAGEIPWADTHPVNGLMELTIFLGENKDKVQVYENINVLIPIREYRWEDHHSDINQTGTTAVLAKEFVEYLNLCGQPQTFDMYEKSGKKATISVHHGDKWHTYLSMIYIRKDLLGKYLEETKKCLVWAIWGERALIPEGRPVSADDKEDIVRYRDFQQIFRYEP